MPIFALNIDRQKVAFIRNSDVDEIDSNNNSITMTRNIHLQAGQIVSVGVAQMDRVYGNGGQDSWFTGHLIYLDV